MIRTPRDGRWITLAAFVAVLPHCHRGESRSPRPAPVVLDAHGDGWLPANLTRINRLLAERGIASPQYDPAHRPVAVFDWDNTMMRNDIGDATFFWMLRHDKIRQPPARNWSITNRNLTTEARTALNTACDALATPGQPLPTSTNAACADALVAVYDRGHTPAGAPAWQPETTATMHQEYAWGAQLQAGYTPDEIRGFAASAFEANSHTPRGTTQSVGTTMGLDAHVEIYPAMRNLTAALRRAGFDVWVVSASSQYLVETVGAHAGFAMDHVVGIRTLLESDGRTGYRLTGCGTEPDGADTVITFDQGKRCWINRAIFRRAPADQLPRATDRALRPTFAAGDSDTDLAMVQDATDLKLVVDRHRPMVLCNALGNAGGRWMVQPMFFDPLPPHSGTYPCSTTLDHAGRALTDEDGHPIADQH